MKRMALALVILSAAGFGFGATKDRKWETGKVADLQADQQPTTGPLLNSVTVKESAVRIVGADYEYIAYDSTSAQTGLLTRTLANRKHGCRFIVNDEVRYAHEKSKLYVRDADGKECKLDILRQERLSERH
jgi:hypothetical protein